MTDTLLCFCLKSAKHRNTAIWHVYPSTLLFVKLLSSTYSALSMLPSSVFDSSQLTKHRLHNQRVGYTVSLKSGYSWIIVHGAQTSPNTTVFPSFFFVCFLSNFLSLPVFSLTILHGDTDHTHLRTYIECCHSTAARPCRARQLISRAAVITILGGE